MSVLMTRLAQLIGLKVMAAVATGVIAALRALFVSFPIWKETKNAVYWMFQRLIYGI